jgi:hypothetical protein
MSSSKRAARRRRAATDRGWRDYFREAERAVRRMGRDIAARRAAAALAAEVGEMMRVARGSLVTLPAGADLFAPVLLRPVAFARVWV